MNSNTDSTPKALSPMELLISEMENSLTAERYVIEHPNLYHKDDIMPARLLVANTEVIINRAKELLSKESSYLQQARAEGAENWKSEYNNCRVLLNELVALKELKDKEGKTDDYLFRQPIAWEQSKEFLKNYQHL